MEYEYEVHVKEEEDIEAKYFGVIIAENPLAAIHRLHEFYSPRWVTFIHISNDEYGYTLTEDALTEVL